MSHLINSTWFIRQLLPYLGLETHDYYGLISWAWHRAYLEKVTTMTLYPHLFRTRIGTILSRLDLVLSNPFIFDEFMKRWDEQPEVMPDSEQMQVYLRHAIVTKAGPEQDERVNLFIARYGNPILMSYRIDVDGYDPIYCDYALQSGNTEVLHRLYVDEHIDFDEPLETTNIRSILWIWRTGFRTNNRWLNVIGEWYRRVLYWWRRAWLRRMMGW